MPLLTNGVGRVNDVLGVRNFRDGNLFIQDGAPVPNVLDILGADGDLNFTVTDNTFQILSRGVIVGRSQGDQEGMTLTATVKFEQWSYEVGADQGISPADTLLRQGGASNWVSTAICGPYSVNLVYQIRAQCGAGGVEQLTFRDFHADTVEFAEGDEYNTLAITGSCLATRPEREFFND